MNEIDAILNQITSAPSDAMIVRPATGEDIYLCNKDMAAMNFPPMPEGYILFLKMLNGFAWNGIHFLSTDRVTDTDTNFTLSDIVTANEDFTYHNEGLEHCVYLGFADDDMYVYNIRNGRYEVLDISGRDVMDDFETFEAMFVGVVTPRL